MDQLAAMRTFAAVVDAGVFSAAAKTLGQSKATVSKQVSQLEDHLGARLLNRTTRRLSLTEIGQAYLERTRRILEEVEEAERAVSELHGAPRGTIRVNAPMSFAIRHLGPALPEFLGRYPDVSIELSLSDRVVDVVAEGYDLVIRIIELEDSSLIARKLCESRRVLCASPDYLAKRGTPGHPGDLAQHDCLIYANRPSPRDWEFENAEGEQVTVRVNGRLSTDNGDIEVEAALAGLGVSLIPDFLVDEYLADGRLTCILPDWSGRHAPIYAVYPHNRHMSAKVRVFVDFLAERLKK
jgi:DNA-binding transcriptional LysR family regulator